MTEGERLAQFSELVRGSSLKRFKQVVVEDRGWQPFTGQLNFVDLLKHLVDADRWVMAILKNEKQIPRPIIKPGDGKPEEWDRYFREFENLGKEKTEIIKRLPESEWSQDVEDTQVMGKTSKWLILVRGNLDHEIHHRGSLQTMLNLKYKTAK